MISTLNKEYSEYNQQLEKIKSQIVKKEEKILKKEEDLESLNIDIQEQGIENKEVINEKQNIMLMQNKKADMIISSIGLFIKYQKFISEVFSRLQEFKLQGNTLRKEFKERKSSEDEIQFQRLLTLPWDLRHCNIYLMLL